MTRNARLIFGIIVAGVLAVGVSTLVQAQSFGPLHRLSVETQFAPPEEISTAAVPADDGAGGATVYSKTLFTPFRNLFITFSGTGDTHGGAALLMTCVVDGVLCQAGDGLATAGPSGWITLQKVPVPTEVTNCDDGGGGAGDCHDNAINYTWCATVADPGTKTIELKLASSNGEIVFYERAHIIIDAAPNQNAASRCTEAAAGPFEGTLP